MLSLLLNIILALVVFSLYENNEISYFLHWRVKIKFEGFPGGAVVKNPPANAGDTGSSPGPGRSHMPQSN